jgi:hypothetical protein
MDFNSKFWASMFSERRAVFYSGVADRNDCPGAEGNLADAAKISFKYITMVPSTQAVNTTY